MILCSSCLNDRAETTEGLCLLCYECKLHINSPYSMECMEKDWRLQIEEIKEISNKSEVR